MHRHLLRMLAFLAVMFACCQGLLQAQLAAPGAESRYIPDKAIFGAIVRPSAILQNPELEKLYKLAKITRDALPERELGTEFANVELATFGITIPESPAQAGSLLPTIFLRVKDAAALKAVSANTLRPEMVKKTIPGTSTEAYVSPKPNLRLENWGGSKPMTRQESHEYAEKLAAAVKDPDAWKISSTFVFPDERTMLSSQYGSEIVSVLDQLKPEAAKPAWAKQFDLATKFPVAAFVDLKQARELIKAATGGQPPEANALLFNLISPLWEKADLAVIALDTSDGLKLTIVADSGDADSAKAFNDCIDSLLALGKEMLPLAKAEADKLDKLIPGLGAQFYADLEKAVNELSIRTKGTSTIIKFAIQQQTLARINSSIFPLLEKAHAAAPQNRDITNLKTLAMGMHNYNDTLKYFPAAQLVKEQGQPPYSWRVALLPYLDEMKLYQQYKFDEPWDSEANKKVLAQMPAIYRSPHADPASTNTAYVVPTFDKGIFSADPSARGIKLFKIADGLSKTLLILETEATIPWTKPEDLPIDPEKPLPALGFAKCPTLNVAFADGSVARLIKNPTMEQLLPFLTRAAGDSGDLEKLEAPSPAGIAPQPAAADSPVEPAKDVSKPVEGSGP